jgi:hypothetical protein
MCILCIDEALLALAALPLVGVAFRKLHRSFHTSTHHKCHTKGCNDLCVSHPTECVEEVAVPDDWKQLTADEVDELYGDLPTILLMFDRVLLGTIDKYPGDKLPFWPSLKGLDMKSFPPRNEFSFFLSQDGSLNELHARWKNKLFVWNDLTVSWKLEQEVETHEHQSELCEFFKDAAVKFAPKGE